MRPVTPESVREVSARMDARRSDTRVYFDPSKLQNAYGRESDNACLDCGRKIAPQSARCRLHAAMERRRRTR